VKKLIATSCLSLLTFAFVFACGGQTSATPVNPVPDAGVKKDSGLSKPPPPPPREAGVVDAAGLAPIRFPTAVRQGGPVIAAPKVIPIVFAGDPLADSVIDFTRKLGPSDYWKASASEYGVGAITSGDLVVINEAPPALLDDTDVKTWLQAKLGSPEAVLGQPDGSTLYALYYPASTTITLEGDKSCQSFGGYHNETTSGGIAVAYAVMPRCSGGSTSALDYLTVVASHEYLEWATDPFPFTAPAYQGMDNDHLAWSAALGGELSDLCTALDGYRYVRPADVGYSVQTQWSNKASLAGEHPCIPNEGRAYVVAVPETPDSIDVGERGASLLTRGISVPRGGSKTVRIQVHAYGTSSKEPLFLSVLDQKTNSEPEGYTFEFSSDTIAPGQVVNLKITAAKNASYAVPLLVLGDNPRDAGLWPFLIEAR
jgi:hypothetical protein